MQICSLLCHFYSAYLYFQRKKNTEILGFTFFFKNSFTGTRTKNHEIQINYKNEFNHRFFFDKAVWKISRMNICWYISFSIQINDKFENLSIGYFRATFLFAAFPIKNYRSHNAEHTGVVSATRRSLCKFGKTFISITDLLFVWNELIFGTHAPLMCLFNSKESNANSRGVRFVWYPCSPRDYTPVPRILGLNL